jgi:hypothetical protein
MRKGKLLGTIGYEDFRRACNTQESDAFRQLIDWPENRSVYMVIRGGCKVSVYLGGIIKNKKEAIAKNLQ